MNQNTKKAFTLVELIVVIIILAILGTIAFISFQGYSKQARDSRRISDINTIKISLELYSLNAGKYPLPDDSGIVSYSGELLWTQGVIGDRVITNLSRNLQKKPVDPLFNFEYTYSVTNTRKEYELMSIHEGNFASNNLINNSYASNNYYPKISGQFNEIFVKTSNYIVPTPSIITSESLDFDLDLYTNTGAIKSMIITGGDNFPDLNIPNTNINTGGLDINLSVYEGSIIKDSSDNDKIDAINAIKGAYSGTILENNSLYFNILNNLDLVTLAEQLILSKPDSATSINNSNINNSNTYNLTFNNADYWIQEDGNNGTEINNSVLLKHELFSGINWDTNNARFNFTDNDLTATKNQTNWTSLKSIEKIPPSGKYYWEIHVYGAIMVGVSNSIFSIDTPLTTNPGVNTWSHYQNTNGSHYDIGVAIDMDNNKIWFSRDGGWLSGNPVTGTSPTFSNVGTEVYPTISIYHPAQYITANFGESSFVNSAPTGFSPGFGNELSIYPTGSYFYVTTSDLNQLDLSGILKINSVNISNDQPVDTSIKGLVSFDGRNTWKKWNGSNWLNHTGGLNDLENSNTISQIEEGLNNLTITSEQSLDFAFNLSTINSLETPKISEISIDMY